MSLKRRVKTFGPDTVPCGTPPVRLFICIAINSYFPFVLWNGFIGFIKMDFLRFLRVFIDISLHFQEQCMAGINVLLILFVSYFSMVAQKNKTSKNKAIYRDNSKGKPKKIHASIGNEIRSPGKPNSFIVFRSSVFSITYFHSPHESLRVYNTCVLIMFSCFAKNNNQKREYITELWVIIKNAWKKICIIVLFSNTFDNNLTFCQQIGFYGGGGSLSFYIPKICSNRHIEVF